MSYSEFRRWLKSQGATFKAAKGSHFKVILTVSQQFCRTTVARKSVRGWLRRLRKTLE